jgi:hypothetical protein
MACIAPSATFAQQAPVRFEPLVRIGCSDCDGPQLFREIAGLVTDGRLIHVFDSDAPHVRVFDRSGRVVRTFGRHGRGPGELIAPHGPALRADGSLLVFDVRQNRITRFDSTGFVRDTRIYRSFPLDGGYAPGRRALIYAGTDFTGPTLRVTALVEGDSVPHTVHVASPDFPVDFDRTPQQFVPVAVRHDGGFAIGSGDGEYRIRIYSPAGELEHEIRRDVAPLRRTREEMDAVRTRMLAGPASAAGRSDPEARGGTPAPAVSPFKAHFSMGGFRFDDLGRLWVRTNRGDGRRTLFDVFGTRGEYLGELMIPAHIGHFALTGDLLVGVTTDADAVQYVMAWRLVSTW